MSRASREKRIAAAATAHVDAGGMLFRRDRRLAARHSGKSWAESGWRGAGEAYTPNAIEVARAAHMPGSPELRRALAKAWPGRRPHPNLIPLAIMRAGWDRANRALQHVANLRVAYGRAVAPDRAAA